SVAQLLGPEGYSSGSGVMRLGASARVSDCGHQSFNNSAAADEEVYLGGPIWVANTTGWVIAAANLSLRWTGNLSVALGNRSASPFADFQLYVEVSVRDATNNSVYPPSSTVYVERYLFLVNGSLQVTHTQSAILSIPLKLVNGHTFEFEAESYVK